MCVQPATKKRKVSPIVERALRLAPEVVISTPPRTNRSPSLNVKSPLGPAITMTHTGKLNGLESKHQPSSSPPENVKSQEAFLQAVLRIGNALAGQNNTQKGEDRELRRQVRSIRLFRLNI